MKNKWTILTAIIILWVLGGAFLMIYINLTTNQENKAIELTKIAFAVFGGLGVILPTYINIIQSLENRNIIKVKLEYDKVENAYEILKEWDSGELLKARELTRQINKNKSKLSSEQLIEKINTDHALEHSILTIFNYWERIRMSIEYKRVNPDIIKEALQEVYITMYQILKPWIDIQNAFVKADLEKLYHLWK